MEGRGQDVRRAEQNYTAQVHPQVGKELGAKLRIATEPREFLMGWALHAFGCKRE